MFSPEAIGRGLEAFARSMLILPPLQRPNTVAQTTTIPPSVTAEAIVYHLEHDQGLLQIQDEKNPVTTPPQHPPPGSQQTTVFQRQRAA